MMIIRIKGSLNTTAQDKIRERIKKQMEEGLIIHDDTIEITFVDQRCDQCGGTDLEEIKLNNIEGELFSHMLKCNECERFRDIVQ